MKKIIIFLLYFLISLNCFSATYRYFDSSASSGGDGLAWSTAFDYSALETFIEGGSTVTCTMFMKGNFSLTSTLAYSTSQVIAFIGVKSATTNEPAVVSDFAEGIDRLTIALGTYRFVPLQYKYSVKGIIFTTQYVGGGALLIQADGTIEGCDFINTSTDSGAYCITTNGGNISNCYFEMTTARGIYCGNVTNIRDNVFNGGYLAIIFGRDSCNASHNLFIDCDSGIATNFTKYSLSAEYNTFISCSTKAIGFTGDRCLIKNNNFYDNGIDILIGSSNYTLLSGNNHYGYTTRISGSSYYETDYSELDPDFVDTANDNYTPQNTNLIGESSPDIFAGTETTNYSVAGVAKLDASSGGTSYAFEN